MAAIKFNSLYDEFNGSINGQTFYSGNKVSTIKNISSIRISRSQKQKFISSEFIFSTQIWRSLTDIQRLSWITFVSLYPQSFPKRPSHVLTPYELFVKRNVIFHMKPNEFEFFPETSLEPQAVNPFTTLVYIQEGNLYFYFEFERFDPSMGFFLYTSYPGKGSIDPKFAKLKFTFAYITGSDSYFMTTQYLNVWGRLPTPGETVIFQMIQYGAENAHIYELPPTSTIIITF